MSRQWDLFESEPTAMRETDTAGPGLAASGAVAPLIGRQLGLRWDDVDSTNGRSTPATTLMRGIRASTTATRTTTTRTTSSVPVPSADLPESSLHAGFCFQNLVQAYLDCRRTKRNSASALAFEAALEPNLCRLHDELAEGSYRPGRSICFIITRPKPREVWAADFRDRIVHHLLYNRIAPRFENAFIADSCACIPGRGTLYAADRLEHKVRSITRNWSRPAFYLKLDLANFFVSIDKRLLRNLLAARIIKPWWRQLAELVLFHDPRDDVDVRGGRLGLIPPHKSLFNQPAHLGLPIGNLSSQFFANIYLDVLDQHVKHQLRCRHYIRYVDDFLLLHESPQQLNAWLAELDIFLPARLHVRLNPTKTILQRIDRGIDFVGQVIKPWRRQIRRRTLNESLNRIRGLDAGDVFESANSYFGLLRQSTHSHADRARMANLVRRRGHTIDGNLTKAFRRTI